MLSNSLEASGISMTLVALRKVAERRNLKSHSCKPRSQTVGQSSWESLDKAARTIWGILSFCGKYLQWMLYESVLWGSSEFQYFDNDIYMKIGISINLLLMNSGLLWKYLWDKHEVMQGNRILISGTSPWAMWTLYLRCKWVLSELTDFISFNLF